MHDMDSGGGPAPSFRRGDEISRGAHGGYYKILDFLGKGGFGECFSAQSSQYTRDYVALKIVDKRKLKDRQCTKIYREIKLHGNARHKHIVSLFDWFEHEHYFFIVMELCRSRSLLTIINESHAHNGYFDEDQGAHYIFGIVDAVIYLHAMRILHRDIKPGNVFIGRNGDVKLGDFGLAIEYHDLVSGSVSGTPNYLAPEVINKRGHSLSSEVWSIGCLIFCMLVGRPPFEADDVDSTYERIKAGKYAYPPRCLVTPIARYLISRCLELEPNNRIRIFDFPKDPWVTRSGLNAHLGAEISGYPLMRAKSTGNMLRDFNGNITLAPVPAPPARYRPKSAMMAGVNNTSHVLDRSRRKSITAASHDSGFGSESDFFKMQNNAYCRLQERIKSYSLDIINAMEGHLKLISSAMPSLFVAKWVDYSNRRGFGCKLTDGTLTVKFNEGTCVSWPRNSRDVLYAPQPLVGEKVIDAYGDLAPVEFEHVEVAHGYSQYMDRELRGIDYSVECETEAIADSPYIVHHHLDEHHLVVVLSNGTVQVNLSESKAKVVMWRENESEAMGLALLTKDFPPCAFRILHPKSASCFEGRYYSDLSRISTDGPQKFNPYLNAAVAVLEQHCQKLSSTASSTFQPQPKPAAAPRKLEPLRSVQVTSC